MESLSFLNISCFNNYSNMNIMPLHFQTRDSLLLAIDEEYVEGVELLLEHEERIWKVTLLFTQ